MSWYLSPFLSLHIVALGALPQAAAPERQTVVEGISEYRLDNGLRVLLFPDESRPKVTVNITYFVGSRHEGRGETGMAHLLEHLVFKGTPDHANIWKLLEDHGARFNGSTWYDRTNYYETLPASDESLEFALRMEADRMVNSFIQQSDLDTEMTVVRNEFEARENSPEAVLHERILSTAYLWHGYGRSPIGTRSDIERVPIQKLKAFYKKYYRPDNAMLVVAGKFEEKKALELIDKYFGPLANPSEPLENTYTVEPPQDGARHVELRRVGDVAAVGTAYHICAGSHPDYAAIDVLETILDDEPSGRLYEAIVKPGLAASLYGYSFGLKEPGILAFFASVRLDQRVEPVFEKMKEIVEKPAEFSAEEVERAKRRLLNNIANALKETGRIGVELSEWAAMGDWRLYFLHRDRIEQVTRDDVARVARIYLKETNRTSGIYHPTKEPERAVMPETPDFSALVGDYKGKQALAKGESFEPDPEKIELLVERLTLPSGLKLAFLPKRTRGETVYGSLTLRFGSEADLQGRQHAASLVYALLMRGTKNRTYQQIRDELDRLKSKVFVMGGSPFAGGGNSISVSIKTDRQNLAPVIALVAEILREPSFPPEEFEIVRKETLAAIESQLSEPTVLAFVSALRRMNPWPPENIRYIPTLEETIEKIKALKIEEVRKVYEDLVGSSFAQMALVGDFEKEEARKTVEKALGGWKSPRPFRRIDFPFQAKIQASEEVIKTPDKEMAIVGAGLTMELRDDDPDYPALHMANYILGQSANSRLLERLRQKEGLSYGAFSLLMADSSDRHAVFGAGSICAPQNAEKAMKILLEEVERMVREAVSEEELEDAKDNLDLQMENNFGSEQYIASQLSQGLYLGRTLEYHKSLQRKIAGLSASQIQEALKKHLRLERLVKVRAGDFKEGTGL